MNEDRKKRMDRMIEESKSLFKPIEGKITAVPKPKEEYKNEGKEDREEKKKE
jgi:hypothetical protein